MDKKKAKSISADMTVLDIVSEYPATETVFRSYDERTGECVCCRMLFETIQQVADKYKLNLSELLIKLNSAAAN